MVSVHEFADWAFQNDCIYVLGVRGVQLVFVHDLLLDLFHLGNLFF